MKLIGASKGRFWLSMTLAVLSTTCLLFFYPDVTEILVGDRMPLLFAIPLPFFMILRSMLFGLTGLLQLFFAVQAFRMREKSTTKAQNLYNVSYQFALGLIMITVLVFIASYLGYFAPKDL